MAEVLQNAAEVETIIIDEYPTSLATQLTFQDLLRLAKDPDADKDQLTSLIKNNKSLTPNQRDMVLAKIRNL